VPDSFAGIGGRLSVDFCNELGPALSVSWEDLLHFLLTHRIISSERGSQLLALPEIDAQSSEALLAKAQRLYSGIQEAFGSLVRREPLERGWAFTINEILRVTEGHDELVPEGARWHLEFVAREDSLEWLLAAIARSAAEIIAEGPSSPLRLCSNPSCGLFFYDTSRTHRRRWCSMARCGNRHKVAAFSRRHATSRRP
jgi:predicted RNA-binding Zn ribbon-like protein